MADTKISAMADGAPWSVLAIMPIVQGGANKSLTLPELFAGPSGGDNIVKCQSGFNTELQNHGNNARCTVDDDKSVFLGQSTAFYSGDAAGNLTVSTQVTLILSAGSFAGNQCAISFDPVTPLFQIVTNGAGIFITYKPAVAGSWNGAAPNNVASALDRCAALLKTLNGGVGP